jgi:5-methylcytosine-specific restriction endonuclease McrA
MPAARKRTRKPVTPPSRIRSILRGRVWLFSRERAEALKRDGRRCRACGSKEQLEVHHLDNSGIDQIIDLIYKTLLCHHERLITLCKTCHQLHEPHEFDTEGTYKPQGCVKTVRSSGTR